MMPIPLSANFCTPFGTPLAELFGRLCLVHADGAQRLQYLVCRLALGVTDSCLRKYALGRDDDSSYSANRSGPEERIALLLEAGAEGWVTILRAYIDELSQAQLRCLEACLGVEGDKASALRLAFLGGVPLPGVGIERRRDAVSARE